jgi:dinuclear metal center YbgI/SA1388 family protein
MTLVSDIAEFANTRWPIDSAAHWDNPGLALGSPSSSVTKVLLAVDLTPDVLDEAEQSGFQMVFTHHPFLFKAASSLAESSLIGSIASRATRSNIAVFSAHTNSDFVTGGVSQTLAKLLGLSNLRFLSNEGEGVIGDLEATVLIDYARAIARVLPSCAQGVLVQGDPSALIRRVGLVAGAGDSYLDAALASEVDVFITSDLRHHPASDFRDKASLGKKQALISIPHFAAEWPWLSVAAAELSEAFPSVEFEVSEINTDPWTFAVMQ